MFLDHKQRNNAHTLGSTVFMHEYPGNVEWEQDVGAWRGSVWDATPTKRARKAIITAAIRRTRNNMGWYFVRDSDKCYLHTISAPLVFHSLVPFLKL